MSPKTLEQLIEEIVESSPTVKQIPSLRYFQTEAEKRLGYKPGLETIRKLINQMGYAPAQKRSHRWGVKK